MLPQWTLRWELLDVILEIRACSLVEKLQFLRSIECTRCRLLLPMCAVSVCQSVCLSRGSTRLHCAKTAERINTLFGVNSFEGQWNIVLNGSPDPLTAREKGIRCSLRQITLTSCCRCYRTYCIECARFLQVTAGFISYKKSVVVDAK